MSKTKKDVDDKATELMKLTLPLRSANSDVPQRVQSYVQSKTGKKLTEYIGAPEVSFDDKFELLEELVSILKSGDYSKLPTAPNGQAQTPPAAVTAPKVPKPTPAPKPPAEAPAAPAVDPLAAAIAAAKAKRAAAAAEATKSQVPTLDEDKVRAIVAEVCAEADAALEEKLKAHIETRLLDIVQSLAA